LIMLRIDRFSDGHAECGGAGLLRLPGGRLDVMTRASGGADLGARPERKWGCGAVVCRRATGLCRAGRRGSEGAGVALFLRCRPAGPAAADAPGRGTPSSRPGTPAATARRQPLSDQFLSAGLIVWRSVLTCATVAGRTPAGPRKTPLSVPAAAGTCVAVRLTPPAGRRPRRSPLAPVGRAGPRAGCQLPPPDRSGPAAVLSRPGRGAVTTGPATRAGAMAPRCRTLCGSCPASWLWPVMTPAAAVPGAIGDNVRESGPAAGAVRAGRHAAYQG